MVQDEMDFSINFAPEKHKSFYEYIQITGKVPGKNHTHFPYGAFGCFQWMLIISSCFQKQAWSGSLSL